MSAPAAATLKLWAVTRLETAAWCTGEGWNWLFILKTILAVLLAMGISMRFDLDQPRTAMVTVFVVMQPQTGMVLTKSLYRIGGTLAGTLVSLLLVGLFAQERELFILGLALWVGGCTAGAAFYRNFKSYSFVLAGYTAAMIGIPAALQPQAFFPTALSRLTEVILGIVCAGIVSDVVFPRRLSDLITSNVQNRYREFFAFVRASLVGTTSQQELEAMQLRMVGYVISLESIRSAGILEDPEVRTRDLRLRRLNSEFMAVSTTFHSFRALLQRLTKDSTPAGRALIALYESLGETLVLTGEVPRSAVEAHRAARGIAAFRGLLQRRVEQVRRSFPEVPHQKTAMDFDTALELLYRFVRELHAYTRTYAALLEKEPQPKPPDDIRFVSRTDPLVALLSGARASAAILLVGAFWIASAWPYGSSALTFVAVVCALFTVTPDPTRAARRMTLGFSAGFLAALLFKFFVLPSLDGFGLLCAGLVPVLMAGLYLATKPDWTDVGTGFVIFFTTMLAPGNTMQLNPVAFLNEGGATILGILVAVVMFEVLVPASGIWLQRRLARQLRHQVVLVCFDHLDGLSGRFESGTYELLHKLASARQGGARNDRRLFSWMFPVVEVGRAIIHLRHDADTIPMSLPVSGLVRQSIQSTAQLFRKPSEAARDAAIECVADSVALLRLAAESELCARPTQEALRRMQTSLHLIRTALLDEETILVATANDPSAHFPGGIPHAA